MRFQRWLGSNLKTAAACQSKTFESRIFRNGSKKFDKSKAEKYYTGSLAPTDFSGAVFTHAHFQKIAQISSLCDFHYISVGIPFWFLVTT